MLYRAQDFEPLTEEGWDAGRARAAVREIVADTDAALRGPKLLWPADAWDRWRATSPLKDLYVGAAGVLWALEELRERDHAETRLDLASLSIATLERQRAKPDLARWTDLPEPRESSLLSGEAGVLLLAYRLTGAGEHADALHERVRGNVGNEADELMWGAPGTIVAARRMLDWTNDERWRDAWSESADALLARRRVDGLWTQRLYGQSETFLGPVHGYVGNALALVPLLDRPSLESKDGAIRLQWCHGAPGIVASAAPYLDEELLLAGAELTWRAGAHRPEKGASICHGTAGNGYALLKTFARTGDERWLERARRFAVHALAQIRAARVERGSGRHSLFTGDLGVALFVADCVEARATYPVLDA